MKFPLTAITHRDKLEFLYIAQEKLRLDHNAKGEQFRNGEMTEQAFRDYQKNVFDVRQAKLSAAIVTLQSMVFEAHVIGDTDQEKRDKRSRNMALKETMKISTKFTPDLAKDID